MRSRALIPLLLLAACIETNINPFKGAPLLPAIAVEPEAIDFGAVPDGEETSAVLTVENVGEATLTLTDLSLEGPGAFTLDLSALTDSLEPGEQTEAIVTYTPWSVEDTGAVLVESDDPERETVNVPLVGALDEPFLVFSPDPVDFGTISPGAEAEETLTITNEGAADLVVSDLLLVGDGFSFDMPALPFTLAPGESTDFPVTFSPTEPGPYDARLWAESNDRSASESVELLGEGSSPPVAVCSVDPDEVQDHDVRPTWIGDESYDPGGAEIVEYNWTLIDRPTGSAAVMPRGGARRTDFAWDLAGMYIGELVVVNEYGVESEPCDAELIADPDDGLWIELYWTHSGDDMDLHLVEPGGSLWGSTDCHWENCVSGRLNWGDRGTSDDDPSLDIDDIPGTGPENINIEDPEDGDFEVYVHDYPGTVYSRENDITVNIYIGGELVYTVTEGITGEDSMNAIATVSFPDGTVTGE